MTMHRKLIVAALALGLPLTSAAQPAPTSTSSATADADPMSDKARELFNEGNKLFREGKYGAAEASFEAAWGLALKSKGIAANLGECEMRLGKYREAAEHLAISLRLAPPSDPQRQRTAANFAAVKAKIGTLVLKASPDGAEVFVNGQRAGEAPLPDPIFVEPGRVKVRVRNEGYASWEKELDLAAGQEVPLDVTLEKSAPVPSASATATTIPPPPPRSRIPALVLGGAAIVSAAVGAGLLAGSRAEYDKAVQLGEEIRGAGTTCKAGAAGFDARCAQVESAANSSNALKAGGIVGLAVAGAAGAGALLYLLWPAPKPAQGALRLVPVASEDAGGVVVSGSF